MAILGSHAAVMPDGDAISTFPVANGDCASHLVDVDIRHVVSNADHLPVGHGDNVDARVHRALVSEAEDGPLESVIGAMSATIVPDAAARVEVGVIKYPTVRSKSASDRRRETIPGSHGFLRRDRSGKRQGYSQDGHKNAAKTRPSGHDDAPVSMIRRGHDRPCSKNPDSFEHRYSTLTANDR